MPLLPTLRLPQVLLAPTLLFMLIATLPGCGGESHSESASGLRVEAPPVACPGVDLAKLASVIHVAPAGIDSDSCGDKPATACASIGAGIARCGVAGCAVAVQHGLYATTATIVLRDAVSVHGSCRPGDEPDHFYRTVIQASPPPGEPAIAASGINSATAVTGIVVIAKDETAPGEASIAMRISASRGLTLASTTLSAGRGADGATGTSSAGAPGGDGTTPAGLFSLGNGGAACPSGVPASGAGGTGRDANSFSIRSASCGPDCACAADPSGVPAAQLAGQSSGNAKGGAAGGTGAFGGNCAGHPSIDPTPGNGGSGLAGEIGDCTQAGGQAAAASASFGKFAAGRWVAGHGGAGASGGTGSGGGGGGAGGYSTFVPFIGAVESYYGFPGGGGGGGGCGGTGGAGGQQGGASIPLVLIDSSVANLSGGASLVPGPGGNGGTGGAGGAGGPGGVAGNAFNGVKVLRNYIFSSTPVAMPGFGNSGGNGGNGGPGAGGAGGNGGPSVGIALVGNSPDAAPDGVHAGTPGAAGRQGAGGANPLLAGSANSQCRSADGQSGLQGAQASANHYVEGS